MSEVDLLEPPAEAKAAVAPKGRAKRAGKPDVQASGRPDGREGGRPDGPTPKSADAGMGKLSVYVPHSLLKKLTVATAEWDKDKSDIVTQALQAKLSGIVFYDKNKPKPACDNEVIGEPGAAA